MGMVRAHLAVTLVLIATASAPTSTPPSAPPSTPASTPPTTEPDAARTEAALEMRPGEVDFGAVEVGEEEERTVDIVNVGEDVATLGRVEVIGSGFSTLFDTCSGAVVEPDEACAVTVVFAPTAAGSFDGLITLSGPGAVGSVLTGAGVTSAGPTIEPGPPTTSGEAPSTEPPVTAVPTTDGEGVPVTTVPEPPDDLRERLAQCERDAAEAEIAFTPALEMVVGDVTDVVVQAVVGEGPVLTAGPGPPITVVPAVLRCEVEATLIGQNFDIDPSEPQAASFIDRPTIEWRWQVTPRRAGNHTLHVRIVPIARSDALRLPGTPSTFSATITVDAAKRTFWQRADDVARGIGGHPLVTGFGALVTIAAVLAASWRWVLRRPWPWKRPGPPPTAPTRG